MKYEHDILTILYFSFSITFSLKGTEVILKNCFIGMESFVFTFESCLPHYCTLPTSIGQITFFFFFGTSKKSNVQKGTTLVQASIKSQQQLWIKTFDQDVIACLSNDKRRGWANSTKLL